MTTPVIEVLGLPVRAPVTVATNLGLAVEAVWLYRRIRPSRPVHRSTRLWDGFVLCAGLAAFVGASVTLANAAVGLLLPFLIEGRAARRGRPGAGRVATGLAIPFGAVVLQLLKPRFGRWVSHVAVEHVLLFVGLLLVQSGVTAGRGASDPAGPGEHVRLLPSARHRPAAYGLRDARGSS
ncbi:MAG: hypothetical protein PVI57_22880 [Gemmatimonadota bacterium]|jgi:hypothetical protein